MKINRLLGFALLILIAGCTSIRTTSLDCTSVDHEEQDRIFAGLDRMLVNNGFIGGSPDSTPWGRGWENSSSSPLWRGRAEFQVAAETNTSGMVINVLYYRGRTSANKALVDAILACVQSNAPSAMVNISAKREFVPAFFGE